MSRRVCLCVTNCRCPQPGRQLAGRGCWENFPGCVGTNFQRTERPKNEADDSRIRQKSLLRELMDRSRVLGSSKTVNVCTKKGTRLGIYRPPGTQATLFKLPGGSRVSMVLQRDP